MPDYGNFKRLEAAVDGAVIPKFALVEQLFDTEHVEDIPSVIRESMRERSLFSRIKKGYRVAIACGSRQIANLPLIVRTIVEIVREQGGEPFIIPAMGSHGGAEAEGQREILESYGITEEAMEAPIVSDMAVSVIAHCKDGSPVYVNTPLLDMDAIILCNRIKFHPGLVGKFQSGLAKMSVIGLGKQKGAESCHKLGTAKMPQRIDEMSEIILEKMPIIFGVGILENSYDETAQIHCIPGESIRNEEHALLEKALSIMPKIKFSELDILIADEVGKNISGVCADPAVHLRFLDEIKKTGEKAPTRFIMSDLTPESEGAASGMGQADIITKRLYDKIDFEKTYINSMTASFLLDSYMPVVMRNDYYALKLALQTSGCLDESKARIVKIKNTLQVRYIYISEALLEEAARMPDVRILSDPFAFDFDEEGNFINPEITA